MDTTELIEIARELGAHHYLDTFEKECICFVTEELQQFAQRIEQPNKQRIAELEHALNYVVLVYMVSDYSPDQDGDTKKAIERLLVQARKALEQNNER